MKKLVVLIVLVLVAGGGGYEYWRYSAEPASAFRKVAAKHGELLATISATGTIEPEEVVDVGAQVAGRIESFGPDPRDNTKFVDYGTPVEIGSVLANIDPALYKADVDNAQAALGQAQANVQLAQANLVQAQAKLYQAEQDWLRAQKLEPSVAITKADYDMFQANYKTGQANVGVGEASLVSAKKAVVAAEATLSRAKTNLSYCTIKSPVKGVIVDRRVNIGQTVVSSLSAPSLFLIAKDLKRLQVWASVNEADIGQITKDQKVTFNVDAYPGRVFTGVVGKVRLNATMTQNVVTYTVEINTENADGKLLPYLTANVQFEISKHDNVLLVPNVALRWMPQPGQIQAAARRDLAQSGRSKDGSGKGGAKEKERQPSASVWLDEDGFARPVRVRIGPSDGNMTEILSGELKDGDEVIVGEVKNNGGGQSTTNPFAPQMFGGKKAQ